MSRLLYIFSSCIVTDNKTEVNGLCHYLGFYAYVYVMDGGKTRARCT